MKLNLTERISIGVICPEKDNIDRLLIRKSVIKKTEITDEEGKKYDVKQVGNSINWNEEGVKSELEVEFSESELNYLREVIKELSTKKELHFTMVDLYQKLTK